MEISRAVHLPRLRHLVEKEFLEEAMGMRHVGVRYAMLPLSSLYESARWFDANTKQSSATPCSSLITFKKREKGGYKKIKTKNKKNKKSVPPFLVGSKNK
jgi:hypothetical protein